MVKLSSETTTRVNYNLRTGLMGSSQKTQSIHSLSLNWLYYQFLPFYPTYLRACYECQNKHIQLMCWIKPRIRIFWLTIPVIAPYGKHYIFSFPICLSKWCFPRIRYLDSINIFVSDIILCCCCWCFLQGRNYFFH